MESDPIMTSSLVVLMQSVKRELQFLSVTFCNNLGIAERVNHPKLLESKQAINGGGFYNIERVEIHPNYQGKDLGLRLVHESLVFLDTKKRWSWTLAVIQPGPLGDVYCKWKKNDRVGDYGREGPSPEQKRKFDESQEKVTRQFSRLGFAQVHHSKAWFLTKDSYGSISDAPSRWLTKEQAKDINIWTPPKQHEPSGLDEELGKVPSQYLGNQQKIKRIRELVANGASIHGSRVIFKAIANSMVDGDSNVLVDEIILLGGDINQQDESGDTPLHVAAGTMMKKSMEHLIFRGADQEVRNNDGKTAGDLSKEVERSMQDFKIAMGLPF